MNTDFTTWPQAPEYRFARAVIARLQEDADLAPLVYAEPFDRDDQCQKLGANARSFGGCIMVTPQPPQGYLPEVRSRVLIAPLGITILATKQVSAGNAMTAADVVATIRAKVLRQLAGWLPEGRGILPEEPQLEGCEPLDTAAWKDWHDLAGCLITLTKKLPY